MKRNLLLFLLVLFTASGCAIIEDIRRGGSAGTPAYSSMDPSVENELNRASRGPSKPRLAPAPRKIINSRRAYLSPRMSYENSAIANQDIFLGMSTRAVKASWGEPKLIEQAGNPSLGYQRWQYESYIPSVEGYVKELRIVYFENNRVVGWETH